jgi:DNA helicase II / ATP-dependent DNA helicase PcrA
MGSIYLDELNDVQQRAVTTSDGPVMVIAGPGSGKTRVLTFRIAYMLEQGIAPSRILALTFTNKAAREMKERIEKLAGKNARYIWAGTFHSLFARILRIEAQKIGYPPDFTIYDTEDTKSVLNEIIQSLKLDKNTYNVNAIKARISSAKSNIITPEMYERDKDLRAQDEMSRRPFIHKIYSRYVEKCKQSGAMDFDDLLLQLYKLFKQNPDNVVQKYRDRFEYVLVDEFQDTNHLQYAIVKQLTSYPESKENVCIVGDDAQSIYSFRGATISNILDFEKDYKNVQVFKLEQNYRSTDHIVQAANEVITYNKKQIQKQIWTDQGGGNRIKVIKALTDVEEGRRVADTIVEQKTRHHIQNKDIAILYRTNAQSRVFEEFLRRQNLSYRIFGGLSFYQRREVKDLIAYLRLSINSRDDEAFKRVINQPKRGIGKTSLDQLLQFANEEEISLWQAVDEAPLGSRPLRLMQDFKRAVEVFQKRALQTNAYDAAIFIAKQSGLYDMLKNDTSIEGINRFENVNSLLDGIKEFIEEDEAEEMENVTDKSLSSYLQSIALLTDMDEQSSDPDFITLMSVHAAKGLEFKSIFVVGIEENLFPSYMAMGTPEQIDEERRLFYVAITRAKEYLTLSYSGSRYQFGQMRYNEPSRFLSEINPAHLEHPGQAPKVIEAQPAMVLGVRPGVKPKAQGVMLHIDPSTFKPSPSNTIESGMNVLHMKFGRGKVLAIDGHKDSKVATIEFEAIENPKRRIMLKFAKLQIVDN